MRATLFFYASTHGGADTGTARHPAAQGWAARSTHEPGPPRCPQVSLPPVRLPPGPRAVSASHGCDAYHSIVIVHIVAANHHHHRSVPTERRRHRPSRSITSPYVVRPFCSTFWHTCRLRCRRPLLALSAPSWAADTPDHTNHWFRRRQDDGSALTSHLGSLGPSLGVGGFGW